jgi:hypothetical protein
MGLEKTQVFDRRGIPQSVEVSLDGAIDNPSYPGLAAEFLHCSSQGPSPSILWWLGGYPSPLAVIQERLEGGISCN